MKERTTKEREQEMASTVRRWPGYTVAVAGTAVAVLIRWALLRAVGELPLYLPFYPVVVIAAVVGGTGPGVLATLLSVLAATLLFIEPVGKLAPGTTADAVGLGLFIAINLVISLLGGRLRLQAEALRESGARLRLVHQAAHIGAFEWNVQSGVDIWTPEMEAMYGLKPGQFDRTHRSWEQLLYPEDRAQAVAAVERALKTFQPQEGEWRVVWSDGSVHWLIGRFQAFKDHAGKPLRLVGANVDITGRKRAEEAVRQSEEHFRTMADAIPQLAWIARADGYVFWYNRRWYEYTGTTPEQMEGWGWQRMHEPQVLPQVLERWRGTIATGQPFEMEFPLRGADGRFRPFLTRIMPLKDNVGRVVLWFGTNTDITELRERQWGLARQARLIDLAPAATLVRRPDGTITFWSRGAERLYGWSREEALGRRTHELLRTEFSEPLESIVARLRGGGTWSGELRHYTREGRQVVVESYWLAELNAQGEVEELLESNTDITERKRLQEHLEEVVAERTAKLREALAELEHMSYSMVHDMRAPLRAMQSFAGLLQEDCADCQHAPGLDYLQRIRESCSRLDRLVTDALNYNKVVRENLPVAPVDLGRLLRGIIETYPNLQPQVADITMDFESLLVLGNESLLTQCCGNLLGNAVKFVAPGIKPRIRVWVEPSTLNHQPSSIISIQDNGIGIPQAAQEKIFRMFQRMHRESEYPGTGIGLSIVRKAVERMNGRVGLESTPGHGSRFWFELPQAAAAQAQAPLQHAA